MTNDQTTNNNSSNTWENGHNHWKNRDYLGWAKAPGFHPLKAATVVAGLVIFPPLGLAALVYFLWNSRRGNGGPAFAHGDGPAFAQGGGRHGRWGHRHGGCGHRGRTGNAAFDQHQSEVMQGLRAEREAFWAYRTEERQKRDQEAYDAFRASEAAKKAEPKAD
jgi:Protein of unknown function (DUF2852)